MYNINTANCIGNNIKDSKNCFYCFNVTNSEDCRYLYDVLDAKDCYDLNYSLYKPEKSYELISTLAMKFSAFCMASHYCSDSYYLDQCNNSNSLFGCIALNQKKYCILNKQYSKEEYEELMPKIIDHMKSTGEFGEFFPTEISPFKYEETVAHEYFPKKQVEQSSTDVISSTFGKLSAGSVEKSFAPDNISDIDESICDQVMTCEVSGKPFKIVSQEFKFYKKMNLPIPHLCPDERYKARQKIRNPRALWQRKCMETGKDIWTSYSPNREERVVCEESYNKVIY